MILVVGGTGRLGTLLVQRLIDRGADVRVVTRDAGRAAHLPGHVETVVGDLRDMDSMASAVRGCATVVSTVQGLAGPGRPSPEAIDRAGNERLFTAAATAGVEHLVLVSVHNASPDHPMPLHRAKFAAEQALRTGDVPWTVVRPTAFMETWIDIVGQPIAEKGQAMVFGPGLHPINFVCAHDVADAVDLAVRDSAQRGRILEVVGPQNLGLVEIAHRLIEAGGEPGRVRHVPLPVLRAMSVLARPVSPVRARLAHAAVLMNSLDMTADTTAIRDHLPGVPVTTLDDVVARTSWHADAHG